MACRCPHDVIHALPPTDTRKRHEVLSGGRVVFRTFDQDQAETVAARWSGGTVRSVDHSTTPYRDT
ncbi:hypothetical protein J7E96_19390 [Streptomyces sp. ISL-96]|uniref:hypothetical protein n=1 Tax=Streptomyces sp. ISL-96 TaxID=2819191 RepID=UPI001BE578D9|nr:hypothetical protein [Streptomyces sp. ISL-96]MBT2490639.1 hypothetical protein [Streptomyces sp. ISL-96]